jgi:hypothetical protein
VASPLITILMAALAPAFFFSPQTAEILGPVTRSQILAALPDWEARTAAYEPHPEAIEALKRIGESVLIEVYFGSWCSDSRAHLPALFKILDRVDNPQIQVNYAGIPRDKSARAAYLPPGKDIVRLPTFLVIVQGREKGRLVETPVRTVEEDLAALITP